MFFELRHYGDLHLTRSFVRHVINNIPAKNYVYVLAVSSKVFSDFPELVFEEYDEHIHPFQIYSSWSFVDGVLYINTSCGANEMAFYQGTTIQTAHSIFSFYLKELCNYTLPSEPVLFIPTIDFNYFKVKNIDNFMKSCGGTKKILIVNGITLSGQAPNFDMYPIIQILAYQYPEYMFFISNSPKNVFESNVVYCKDVINIDGTDIVETSYFSRFCDVIIGRSSGVYTLSVERNNVLSGEKKFVCFCHTERDKDLGIVSLLPKQASNFIWSNNFDYSNMFNVIKSVM